MFFLLNNPKLRDSSKLIFGDNTLRSQFLRDYADLEILRHVQPEDTVEETVTKIKERKMGMLFENIQINFEEEKRKTAEVRAKLEAELQATLEAAQQEQNIYKHILRMVRQGASDEEITLSLARQFSLSQQQAEEKLALAFEE